MLRKIIYLINPISGTRGKELLLKMIEQKTQAANIAFEILPTNAKGDYSFLQEKISKEQITDIVICGGDGSVNQVANALINIPVTIGIIPMGSGNGLAFAAKIPKSAAKALDIIFTGKAAYIDSLFINGRLSCMLCGVGFDAQVAQDFAKQSKRGLLTYIQQSWKNFIKATPYTFEITNHETHFKADAYFISIANGNQFGNNFTIAPKASLNDGLLDIVVVKQMSKIKMVGALLKHVFAGEIDYYKNSNFHKKDILYFQTDKLTIINPSKAPLHIDGDPAVTAELLTIEIIPNAFRLLQP
ncbi:MAG TPA: YegS/Rv2252/BmrU family lipid kinase [Ferruginibacter sp.]|nr:YegS/Rv2252/BmrU family lipid kinase [Ferruginibacter sp.]